MTAELLVILALVLANGVFAGAEIALLSLRRTRLEELIARGSGAARAVLSLRERPERLLATVQVGITVVGSTAAAFGGASISQRLAPLLVRAGLGERTAAEVALAAVVAGVSYLSLVLGELVPKSLALRVGEPYALAVGRPLLWLSSLVRPLVWLLTASSNLVLRLFGDRTSFTESRLSPDELQQLVEEAAKSGSLHPRTGDIATRAFDLAGRTVGEVMVPRPRVVALRRDAPLEEVKRVLLEEGHSRIPVYEGNIDRVVGYVLTRDLAAVALEGGLVLLEDALRPPYFVPETARALDVLQQLQARRVQLGVVVDEAGGMAGIVTMEDLLEELVGDIFSETDEVAESPVQREPDGSARVEGTAPVRDVNRELGLDLPEGDWSTVGGLCTFLAGNIPTAGAHLRAPDGTELVVLEATARRVVRVRLVPVAKEAKPEPESPSPPGRGKG